MELIIESKFIKADDKSIDNKVFTIVSDITPREIEDKYKPGSKKTLIDIELESESGKTRTLSLNKTSQKFLIKEFGNETTNWKGKKIKLLIVKQIIQGELKDTIAIDRA